MAKACLNAGKHVCGEADRADGGGKRRTGRAGANAGLDPDGGPYLPPARQPGDIGQGVVHFWPAA